MDDIRQKWAERLAAFIDGRLDYATVSGKRKNSIGGCDKVGLRGFAGRDGAEAVQFEYFEGPQVRHVNLPADEAAAEAARLLAEEFLQLQAERGGARYHATSYGDRLKIKTAGSQTAGPAAPRAHDKRRAYILREDTPHPFLTELGVTDADGRPFPARMDKFRQINKYLEFFDSADIEAPAGRPLEVVDFGCGKAYLTFALYYYFTAIRHMDARVFGVDRKSGLMREQNELAAKLGYTGLSFHEGEIADFESGGAGPLDLAVSLHACDTATDDALAWAVERQAAHIFAVPCCQHELFGQLRAGRDAPRECARLNHALLRHGVLRERFAAMLTDSLRASLLEACGYSVQVVEFIDMEHTPKNILIRANRMPDGARTREHAAQARREYEQLRDAWGVRPCLEGKMEASQKAKDTDISTRDRV